MDLNTIMACYYKFKDLSFKHGRLMDQHNEMIRLPPKETSILELLLQNACDLVSKDEIIRYAWKGGDVSDESLTRCIYVLRRSLGHFSSEPFIETVYGKGYRFLFPTEPVFLYNKSTDENIVYDSQSMFSEVTNTIAFFPFQLSDKTYSGLLHEQIVEWLHSDKIEHNLAIDVVSSSMTRIAKTCEDFVFAIKSTNADYYITGLQLFNEKMIDVRIELVNASDHSVLHRGGVRILGSRDLDLRLLYDEIVRLLKNLPLITVEEKLQDYDTSDIISMSDEKLSKCSSRSAWNSSKYMTV